MLQNSGKTANLSIGQFALHQLILMYIVRMHFIIPLVIMAKNDAQLEKNGKMLSHNSHYASFGQLATQLRGAETSGKYQIWFILTDNSVCVFNLFVFLH